MNYKIQKLKYESKLYLENVVTWLACQLTNVRVVRSIPDVFGVKLNYNIKL